MENYANYYIKSKNEEGKIIIFTDQNPQGVTLMIKDTNENGMQISFNLPRFEMIAALKYVLRKLETEAGNEAG